MAIPGQKPELDIRGKVRTGEQRKSNRTGRMYPASTDYFLCNEDPDFAKEWGEKPNLLLVRPAFDTIEEAFSTGLEWWTQTSGGNKLACYTKDGGDDPIAMRAGNLVDEDDVLRGEPLSGGRQPITCRFRECPHFGPKGCKPMGRFIFYTVSEAGEMGPYQMDTKSWNAIGNIEKTLRADEGEASKHMYKLEVVFKTEGDKKFPYVTLERADTTDINKPKDVADADAILELIEAHESGCAPRETLAAYLDATSPDWKNNPEMIARIQEIGPEQAVKNLIAKHVEAEL